MKNATKHADKLRSLLRALLREGKPPPLVPMDPLHALVRAAMLYDMSDARADEAMRLIEREFVDLNELRVATELEVQELLGARYDDIEQRVRLITRCLNAIFEREHTLNLDRLRTVGRREARQFLRDLPEMHPFVDGYVMLFGFESPAVPVDRLMLEYLRDQGIADETATLDELQRFLEHQLKPEECYDFYACVRREVCSDVSKRRKAKA